MFPCTFAYDSPSVKNIGKQLGEVTLERSARHVLGGFHQDSADAGYATMLKIPRHVEFCFKEMTD